MWDRRAELPHRNTPQIGGPSGVDDRLGRMPRGLEVDAGELPIQHEFEVTASASVVLVGEVPDPEVPGL
jgi:hypothetical protein